MSLPEITGYAVDRLLGSGASCRVYLAHEVEGLRRPVALKVFLGEDGRAAYERELAMASRIEEIRRRERALEIVQALGSGVQGEMAFIALEYLEHGSLMDLVQRDGPLSLGDTLEYVHQASRALRLLHAEGIFHRDVKPANLLLGGDGRVRLADFGLSRPLDGTLSAAGSPAFAAPEVIAGKFSDGRLVDVYSLGATMAFLLTGETMLPGRADLFALERHGVPRWVQRVILDATSLDATERLPGIGAILEALEAGPAGRQPYRAPEPPAEERAEAPEDRVRLQKVEKTIERSAYAAAAATLIPIPGSEIVAVVPIQAAMVVEIGQLHGVELDKDGASELLASIATTVGVSVIGTKVASVAAKLILPGLGGVLGAPFAFATTLALGTVAQAHFESGGLTTQEIKALYHRSLRDGRSKFDPGRAKDTDAMTLAEEAVSEVGARPSEEALDAKERLTQLDALLERGLIGPSDYREVKRRILDDLY